MTETHVNFLGGSPLNRLSWLRSSSPFLSAVLVSPATRWILFNGGQPLVRTFPATRKHDLARLTSAEVRSLLGPEPIFGQGKEPGEQHASEGDQPPSTLEAARLHGPAIVFLGLHEPEDLNAKAALPSSDFSAKTDPQQAASNIEGTPYFALDVTEVQEDDVNKILRDLEGASQEGFKLEFVEPRGATSGFTAFEAAVFASGRSMVDWNTRNNFCPACGAPTYSLWAGWKLGCSSLLPWTDNTGKKPCPSAKGVHNFSHPRTDPVVIMAVLDEKADKILLGRNKRFPDGFYSTLAGFMEPGESFEDAVQREIWEEAAVKVWGVKYHSGQPWPYPANLMVGLYAFADSTQPVRTDLDNELVEARWYTRAEIQAVLAHPQGARIARREYKKFDDDEAANAKKEETQSNTSASGHAALAPADPSVQAQASAQVKAKADAERAANQDGSLPPPPFRVPPLTAIAGVLISDWAYGRLGSSTSNGGRTKGNL